MAKIWLAYYLLMSTLLFSPAMAVTSEDLPPTPITNTMTGIASYYDYTLDWLGERSKSHSTCAFHHQKKDYKMYRVTNLDNWKYVDCYNNDWMRRADRLVDLSSHAFRQIGSTKKWLLQVSVVPIE